MTMMMPKQNCPKVVQSSSVDLEAHQRKIGTSDDRSEYMDGSFVEIKGIVYTMDQRGKSGAMIEKGNGPWQRNIGRIHFD
jgi:hypothetical protein